MRKTNHLFVSLALGVLLLSSCCISEKTLAAIRAQRNPSAVDRVMLIWLKSHSDALTRSKIIDAAKGFREIPGVLSLNVGEPLSGARPAVDNSFDIAIAIRFKDRGAMDSYEPHPKLVKAMNDLIEPSTRKLVVHDSVAR